MNWLLRFARNATGFLLTLARNALVLGRVIGKKLARLGYNHQYDLAMADEVFAIFAGVTLFVTEADWLLDVPRVIAGIITFVGLTVVACVVAMNMRQLFPRIIAYLTGMVFAWLCATTAMYLSANDLAPQSRELYALPVGLIVWATIREASVFVINGIKAFSAKEEQ